MTPNSMSFDIGVDMGDIHALYLNDSRQHLPALISLPTDSTTYDQQVAALLSDRQALLEKGIAPDGYIDELLVKIAKEGKIRLPSFVDPNRPSVFDAPKDTVKLGGEDYDIAKLFLVRVQDNFDNSKVEDDRLVLARTGDGRNTFHFTVNAVVESHAYGAFNGEAVVISPMRESFSNGQHPSGFGMADTWINAGPDQSISLPKATVIVPRDSIVPPGVDVIRYDRGVDEAATVMARDRAVAGFFESKGASLHKVGFDNWSDGAASQDEYAKLLKTVVGAEAADKVYVGRHSNSYDGTLEDLFAMKSKIQEDARGGQKYWEDPSGVQLPVAYRVKQLDQEIGDKLSKAIAASPSDHATDFYLKKAVEHGVSLVPVAAIGAAPAVPAMDDPLYRQQLQGLKDITAALNGEQTSPVRLSTDPKPEKPIEQIPSPYQQGRSGGEAQQAPAPALTPYQQGRSGISAPPVAPAQTAEVKAARGMRR